MPPRPPIVRDQLVSIIARWPGLTAKQLALRVRSTPASIMTTLKVAIDGGLVERRKITDPYSNVYGQVGYYEVTKNPL